MSIGMFPEIVHIHFVLTILVAGKWLEGAQIPQEKWLVRGETPDCKSIVRDLVLHSLSL